MNWFPQIFDKMSNRVSQIKGSKLNFLIPTKIVHGFFKIKIVSWN